MPDKLPIHAETLRGIVMHDLGQLELKRREKGQMTLPNLGDARKLTAARGGKVGVRPELWEQVAQAAIRDWRASRRAGEMSAEHSIGSAYLKNAPSSGVIGVRVVVELSYPNGKPPGAKSSASIVTNAQPNESLASIVSRVLASWNSNEVATPHNSDKWGKATSGKVTQIVEGGFAQSQI